MAIKKSQFIPYYQPITDSKGNVVKAEILIRWLHPQKGLLQPKAFINFAEQHDLIVPITSSLFDRFIIDCTYLNKSLPLEGFMFSLNISAQHLSKDHGSMLYSESKKIIDNFSDKAILVCFELTETDIIKDLEYGSKLVNSISELGISFAIDDFGTGNASFDYLQKIKFDFIKIDRSFVSKVISDDKASRVVKGILNFSKALDLLVISEGIETEEQLNFLQKIGVNYYQGYLFSKPLSAKDFSKYLKSKHVEIHPKT
ncbi:EAL domain-containing protein [Vibrio sp. V36_P2S2PM302]|nr:EAL domain-containing protein [Vibrio sp. V36_P2S2PM302]